MSAPVLTVYEQRASISGKKKKKKTIKNLLTVPNGLKTEPPLIQACCIKALVKILERLLPTARIPVRKTTKSNKDSKEETNYEMQLKKEAKKKRNQLSLGVNALNRNIKKDLISTVLFADNIQPKFLIYHLNLLCNHKKIPYLHIPGLREITNKCLGFPCIAVGFKKDFCDFSDAVGEIISISKTININSNEVDKEVEFEEEISSEETDEKDEKSDETPFTYLWRTSTSERIFVPEKSCNGQTQRKDKIDFINIEKFDNENENSSSELQSPLRIREPVKKFKKLENFESFKLDDNEDLEVPKKKSKKNWIIDKRPAKQNIKYHTANVMKFSSNPNRIKKNK